MPKVWKLVDGQRTTMKIKPFHANRILGALKEGAGVASVLSNSTLLDWKSPAGIATIFIMPQSLK